LRDRQAGQNLKIGIDKRSWLGGPVGGRQYGQTRQYRQTLLFPESVHSRSLRGFWVDQWFRRFDSSPVARPEETHFQTPTWYYLPIHPSVVQECSQVKACSFPPIIPATAPDRPKRSIDVEKLIAIEQRQAKIRQGRGGRRIHRLGNLRQGSD